MEKILIVTLVLVWSSMGVSILLSTIQSMIYDFKREKRELKSCLLYTSDAADDRHLV